jgi:hypothetical protein
LGQREEDRSSSLAEGGRGFVIDADLLPDEVDKCMKLFQIVSHKQEGGVPLTKFEDAEELARIWMQMREWRQEQEQKILFRFRRFAKKICGCCFSTNEEDYAI